LASSFTKIGEKERKEKEMKRQLGVWSDLYINSHGVKGSLKKCH